MSKSAENAAEKAESVEEQDVAVSRKEHAIMMWEHRDPSWQLIDKEEMCKLGYGEFIDWLKDIARYGNVDRTMLFFKNKEKPSKDNNVRVRVIFFTSEHKYAIHAVIENNRKDNKRGYLGGYADTRKPRVGETWTRGSDLIDGDYCKKTFDYIIKHIVRFEMKNLQCW